MDYALHIARKKIWDGFGDAYGSDISLEEWLAVVKADPELRLDSLRELPMPAGQASHHTEASIAVWTRRPRRGRPDDMAGDVAGDMTSFCFTSGNVVVKNPRRDVRRKMWRIAQTLTAKVQGDDGEFYDRCGNPIADAAQTQGCWPALCRSLAFRFIWGDPAGSDVQAFARFPVVDSIYKSSPSGTPQVTGRRVLQIAVAKDSLTRAQHAAIATARERAKILGIDFVVSEE
jgi:hypothetical protein